MSVTLAPRARMAVNASWPGVSRKVILRPSTSAWYAPMCCVIPPASVSTTDASRIASSSVVFPWSTCPMIVTTGGRGARSSSASSYSATSISSSAACLIVTSRSSSVAMTSISSSDSDCVAVRIWPSPMRILMSSPIGTPSACEMSLTVAPDSTVTGPVGATTGCCWRGGPTPERSRGCRPSRLRAPPPSMTTRLFLPPGPWRGRIGRLGLLRPSAIRAQV